MKKFNLLLLGLMISAFSYAQSYQISTVGNSLRIASPDGYQDVPLGKVVAKYYKLYADSLVALSSDNISLLGSGVKYTQVKDGTGATFTSMANVRLYLRAMNIGTTPVGSGGGSGGGGDASASNQSTQIARETTIATNTGSIDSKTPTLGQKNSAGSSSIVVANDQSPIPVSVTGMTRPLNNRVPSSVTVGTSSTSLVAANASGYRVLIQVPSTATASVWISFGTATTAPPSLELTAGSSYQTPDGFPDIQAITAISTVSQAVTVITY